MALVSGKRDALATLLDRSGGVDLLFRLRKRLRVPTLSVLTYHRVAELRGDESFDPEVVDATPKQFDEQLRTVARHCNVIGIDELLAFVIDGTPLPSNPCLITFDDGYKDCLNIALPILQKYDLEAVFFIATDFVDERRAYWWDRVHYLIRHTSRQSFEIAYPQSEAFDLAADRSGTVYRLLRIIKDTRELEVERFLDELAQALEVTWTRDLEVAMADELVMSWDEVARMREAGMDIQSHTRSHRVLQTLSDTDLDDELAGSRRLLENKLGAEVRAIAYPVGKSVGADARLCDAVRRAGYQLGFSNVTGFDKLDADAHPLDLSRLGMGRDLSDHLFRSMLAAPWLA